MTGIASKRIGNHSYSNMKLALEVVLGKKTLDQARRQLPATQDYFAWYTKYYWPLLNAKNGMKAAAAGGQYFLYFSSRSITQVIEAVNRQTLNRDITTYAYTIEDTSGFSTLERTCYEMAANKFKALGMQATVSSNEFHVEALANTWSQNAAAIFKIPQATLILGMLSGFFAPNVVDKLLEDF